MFDYTHWLPSISLANLESTHASFIFIINHFYQWAHFPGYIFGSQSLPLQQCSPDWSVLITSILCSLLNSCEQSGYEVFPQRYVWQKIGSREGSGTLKRQKPVKRNWTTGTCPWRTSPVSVHSGFLLHGFLSWGALPYAEEHDNRSWTKISKINLSFSKVPYLR